MSEVAPGLVVDSVTGIDVSLPVAGPGARAYAFLVDWHIRVILALGWFVLGALLYNGRFSLSPPLTNDVRWFGAVVAPALAIYFLYHHAVELAMRGSTPGKRMAGVRIVARDGGAPSAGALLTRNVFRLVDSLPLFYGVGLVAVVLTRDNLRIGDMAAGTLLVFEHADARLPTPAGDAQRLSRLDAAGAARQVLARYGADLAESGNHDDAAWRTRLERLARPQ